MKLDFILILNCGGIVERVERLEHVEHLRVHVEHLADERRAGTHEATQQHCARFRLILF
jgi:hypothetical protein